MNKVNQEYELFVDKFSRETGVKDRDKIVMLMSKLKRAEGKFKRLYMDTEGNYEEMEEIKCGC